MKLLECGLYRGIRLLELAFKIFERVPETRLRQLIKIVFLTGQLKELFAEKKNPCIT